MLAGTQLLPLLRWVRAGSFLVLVLVRAQRGVVNVIIDGDRLTAELEALRVAVWTPVCQQAKNPPLNVQTHPTVRHQARLIP